MSRLVNDLNEISELCPSRPRKNIFMLGPDAFWDPLRCLLGINVKLTLIVFSIVPFLVIYTPSSTTATETNLPSDA